MLLHVLQHQAATAKVGEAPLEAKVAEKTTSGDKAKAKKPITKNKPKVSKPLNITAIKRRTML